MRTRRISNALGCIIKGLVIIACLAILVIIYQSCAGGPIIQRIDKSLPAVSAAPFEIPTVTRTYLAKTAVLNDDGSVTMSGWYERDKRKWVLRPGSITLPKILKPRINRRTEGATP